jgi:AcrR family transcriptional regulator
MGRPREFDIDKAIDTATALFWRKGYEGTSLNDLTGAIRITAPSFYFAFGSKENLFRKVIERYYARCGDLLKSAFDQPTAQAVAEQFLYKTADLLTDPVHAPGCLAMNSSLPCAGDDGIRGWLAEAREEVRIKFRDRFSKARDSGDLVPDADPEALARFVVTIAWGIAIEAQSGASRDALRQTIDVALFAFKEKSSRS